MRRETLRVVVLGALALLCAAGLGLCLYSNGNESTFIVGFITMCGSASLSLVYDKMKKA